MSRSFLAVGVCAVIFVGLSSCGSDEVVGGGGVADVGEVDVTIDVAELDGGAEPSDTQPPDTGPATPEDVVVDVGPAPPSQPCTNNDQCSSGYCLPTPNGRFCAEPCVSSCPKEFICKEIVSRGDVLYVCAHETPYRCNPCSSDDDCAMGGGVAGVCVQLTGGGFCAQACDKEQACVGDGFSCVDGNRSSGGTTKACLPDSGQCPCPDGKQGFCKLTNDFGSCPGTYLCEAGKAGACQGQLPKAELCNLKDDDCDGETDEEVATVSCDLTNAYGTCKGKSLCVGGTVLCQGANPAPEVCNGIDDNCSGQTDEGFLNTDGDDLANCVDSDDDNDGVADDNDLCPTVANKAQSDTDKDKIGDACDCDIDADGVPNSAAGCPQPVTPDNCVYDPNPDQKDSDNDGDGDACDGDSDGDGDPNGKDCAPLDPTISNNAVEVCDGKDNDCDGETDEQDAKGCATFWLDGDADGWGGNQSKCLCKPKSLYSATKSGDCDDGDKAVNPGAEEICGNSVDDNCKGGETDKGAKGCTDFYFDSDGDGIGKGEPVCLCGPTGSLTAKQPGDCDDEDVQVSPVLPETCGDKKDNDCDGKVDEAGCVGCKTLFRDGDQDGYGDASDSKCLSGPTYPYTAFSGGDCDDKDANVKPGALEICNGKDDNCDSLKDPIGSTGCKNFYPDGDKDGYGDKVSPICYCAPTGNWNVSKTGDCDDGDKAISPAAKEVCNGKDDDCDNQVDEGLKVTFFKDNDGDGFGAVSAVQACAAPKGYVLTSGDCNDYNKAIYPTAKELCNTVDDDCNGFIDDGLPKVSIYADVDGDGFGSENAKEQKHCKLEGGGAPLGYSLSKDDCDDSKSTVYPGAPELCDGILNNCAQKVPDAHCPTKCEGSWPVFVAGGSGFPVVAQLDGDNELEVIARSNGTVRALNADGSELWKQSASVSYSYPSLADMDHNATADLVSPGHDKAVSIFSGGDGKLLAKHNIGTSAGWYGAAVTDVDGDGYHDIIATGSAPYKLLMMGPGVKVTKTVELSPLSGEYFGLAIPSIYDVNGDGVAEIFLGTGNWGCVSAPETCKGRLYLFNSAGGFVNDPTWKDKTKPWFQVAGYPKSYAGEGRWPVVADVDGDGKEEVHLTFSSSGSHLWKLDGAAHPSNGKTGWGSFPVLAPVSADGKLDASGKLSKVAGPVVDVDGDGAYEVIGNKDGGMAVMRGGKVMDGYPLSISGGPAVVSDINRDGRLDILFFSGSNNAVNCYTLGPGTAGNILNRGTVYGLGGGLYPSQAYDPFEPNDIKGKPLNPATTTNPLKDSRALRISAMRDVYSSGGGWTHLLHAALGTQGDRDYYVLYGGIIYATLTPMARDYDLYVHIFTSAGKYLATRSSTATGAGKGEAVNCHSTNKCPAGAGMFIIEVRGKDPKKDFGPWPYRLYTQWAQ